MSHPLIQGARPRQGPHLLEAVDHEEDVGVADLGFLPFAVHGVLTGGRKHLLEESRLEGAESDPTVPPTRAWSHALGWGVL